MFWDMTPAEFELVVLGHRRARTEDWRRTRWLGALILNSTGHYKRVVEPADLFELEGDQTSPDSEALDREGLDRLISRFGRTLN